jgi:hypothetical protein
MLEKLSFSPVLSSVVFKSCVMMYCFLDLNFVKICLPEAKWCPKSKVKVNVLNLSDKVKKFSFVERQHVFSGS